ncbi:hypothetical protein GpartN1_g6272.t1 [Galdieria partita]|uniref:UBX domain-containing protein n=1 Tax=Galdieria partita TaxID=83374 RepID=A0A9C7Q1H5_9RHOD|nr:hypothetical protein GpartN1_g6272.t1 [Galdieria partita]
MSRRFQVSIDASHVGKPKKVSIQVTPNTLLSTIREEACQKLQLENSPTHYQLYSPISRKTLDLSLPIRLSNLTPNSQLELRVEQASKGKHMKPSATDDSQRITVAVQSLKSEESGSRCIVLATGQDTLQTIVERVQSQYASSSGGNENSFQSTQQKPFPVLYYVNQPIRNLKTTRLQDLGIVKGSILFRLDWEYRDEQESDKIWEPCKVSTPQEIDDKSHDRNEKKSSEYLATAVTSHDKQCRVITEQQDEEKQDDILEWFENGRLRIYQPSHRNLDPNAVELPESFYEFTLDDLHTWRAEQEKRPAVLLTKEQRQAMMVPHSVGDWVVVRVKFPDGIYMEASFHVKDTLESVYQLLKCLLWPHIHRDIYLFTTPPPRRWVNKDIDLSHFSPRVSFYLGGLDRSVSSSTILKPIVYQRLETSPYEQVIEREEQKAQEIRQQWTIDR